MIRQSDGQRFLDSFKIDKKTGCWVWVKTKHKGYGRFFFQGKTYRAHRLSWIFFNGEIPNELDHLVCDNPSCINPSHLQDTDHRTNVLRGKNICAINARKTHCKHGHRLAGSNLSIQKRGGRRCKACHRRASNELNCKKRLTRRTARSLPLLAVHSVRDP